MGPIGGPEAVFIFFLALMLFGPKKLPELGRTVGKALSEFQRAKREIMATIDRETKQLGLDTEMLTSAANQYRAETHAVDASPFGSTYQSSYGSEPSPEPQAVLPEVAATVPVS
jgi:sec-independent protein translocase protein TatA